MDRLAAYCKSADYPVFLRKLIVQGLIKIEEDVVEVQVRQEDRAIAQRVLGEAVAEFKAAMVAAGHSSPSPRVTLSDTPLPSKACNGGVVLTALDGRIVLNQTVDERLQIAYVDQMPAVRKGLFTGSA